MPEKKPYKNKEKEPEPVQPTERFPMNRNERRELDELLGDMDGVPKKKKNKNDR